MKNRNRFAMIAVVLLAGIAVSCDRFDDASIVLEREKYVDSTRTVSYVAKVTDNGGCARCLEAGYCYSTFDTMPAFTCRYTTVVPLIQDSLLVDSGGCFLNFAWSMLLRESSSETGQPSGNDTCDNYFFRAYVTTNAGTFYSAVDSVSIPKAQ